MPAWFDVSKAIHAPDIGGAFYEGKALRAAERASDLNERKAEQDLEYGSLRNQQARMKVDEETRLRQARDAYNSAKTPEQMKAIEEQFPEYVTERRSAEAKAAVERLEAQNSVVEGIQNEEQYLQALPALRKVFGKGVSETYDPKLIARTRDFTGTAVEAMRNIEVLSAAGLHDEARGLQTEFSTGQRHKEAEIANMNALAKARELRGLNQTPPSPSTGPQRQQAERMVEGDEAFEALGGDDKDRLIDWVSNRAKEIQQQTGANYTDALNQAKDEAKSHIDTEKRSFLGVDWLKSTFDPYGGQQSGGSADPVKIASSDEYNALSSGTVYIDPDGKTRQKH